MQAVLWNILLVHVWHQFIHCFHGPFSLSVLFHKASAYQFVNVKELVFRGKLFKTLRDLFVSITYTTHYHILLAHFDSWVGVHDVVVLDQPF